MLDFEQVRAAAERLHGVAHRTPVVTSTTLNELTGATVFLKAENFQRIGAFKFRGAYNKIASVPAEQRKNGVLAWSSGNHAQAVALAARLHGISATIVMPTDAPPLKRRATEAYGARIVEYDRYTESREEIGATLAQSEGLVVVAPYDDWQVMAGQGTVALELIDDVSTVDVLIAPIGGGGLMAGCGVAARAKLPNIELIGAEPAAGNDTALSLAKGERVTIDVPRTIADGQGATTPGEFTFAVNKNQLDDVVLVDDAEIVAAMEFLFERTKLVVEPSGATGVAALLKSGDRFAGRRIGVVLSGGNIGATQFAELLGRH
jgi:threo-3-hydroxy-L-aspartate ammonia-lyase